MGEVTNWVQQLNTAPKKAEHVFFSDQHPEWGVRTPPGFARARLLQSISTRGSGIWQDVTGRVFMWRGQCTGEILVFDMHGAGRWSWSRQLALVVALLGGSQNKGVFGAVRKCRARTNASRQSQSIMHSPGPPNSQARLPASPRHAKALNKTGTQLGKLPLQLIILAG